MRAMKRILSGVSHHPGEVADIVASVMGECSVSSTPSGYQSELGRTEAQTDLLGKSNTVLFLIG